MAFECASTTDPNYYCRNGGTCNYTAPWPQCSCPSGYQHDYTLFHDPNCGMKTYTYLGGLVICVLITLLVTLWTGCYAMYSRSYPLRHMAALSILGMWLMVLFYLGTWLENGVYESASFFWAASLSIDFCALFYFTSVVLKPDLAHDWRVATRVNKAWLAAFGAMFIACGVAMMITCRIEETSTSGPVAFNYAVGAGLIVFGGANAVYFIMILRDAEYIHSQVKNVHPEEKLKKLEYRIKMMRRTLFLNFAAGIALNIPFPILHWKDGSTKDLYLVTDLLYIGGFLAIHWLLGLYIRWDNHRDKSHLTAVASGSIVNVSSLN